MDATRGSLGFSVDANDPALQTLLECQEVVVVGFLMTRLRQPERAVLDTLVDAGVAKSRSDALAWCVKLVGSHTDEWLTQLRDAMTEVERVRATGPTL